MQFLYLISPNHIVFIGALPEFAPAQWQPAGVKTCLISSFSSPAQLPSSSVFLTLSSVTGFKKEVEMILDYILGGIVSVFLLAYLIIALTRPERF